MKKSVEKTGNLENDKPLKPTPTTEPKNEPSFSLNFHLNIKEFEPPLKYYKNR